MFKLLIGVGVAAAIAAIAYASAATLTVNTNTVQAGTTVEADCSSSVDLSYSVTYDSGIVGYVVDGVTATFDTSGCDGLTADLTLLDESDAILGGDTATVSGPTANFTISPAASAEAIAKASVVVHN
jgi:hypothetical protein